MKTCPTCGNSYSDDLSFCLQDGTRLPGRATDDLTNRPTEIYRPETARSSDIANAETIISYPDPIVPPTAKQFQMSAVEPASRMGCAVTIGQVAAGLLVVVGLGLVGVYYGLRESRSLARLDPYPANGSSANSNANKVSNSSISTSNAANLAANQGPVLTSSTPSGSPKTVSGGVLNGMAISLPKPEYPAAARAVRASGSVSVEVTVDVKGNVVAASAVSGHPLLRAAAVDAARNAKFAPRLLGGQAVKVTGVITYNFVP
jgi:TonB family protein